MVTIKDVAKKSGFSIATVSAVINGVPIVSQRARERIMAAIHELGYRPNTIARSLKSSRTSSLAVIVRDITNPFYPDIISGFEEVAWSNNYEVFLCNTENDPERERKYIDKLIGKRVDGVVIATSPYHRSSNYEKLIEQGIPYIFLNRSPKKLLEGEVYVGLDNVLASVKVIELLTALGYSEIAYMSGSLELSTFKERYEGFRSAMASKKVTINDEWVFVSDYSEEAGYVNMKSMLKKQKLPQAVFCSSDMLAFGVYKAIKEANLRIPEDIALIGIDNNRYSHLINLTSVDSQNKEMGRIACRILLQLLEKKVALDQNRFIVEPHIVVRKTCGRL